MNDRIAENVAEVRDEITASCRKAGRSVSSVRLVAVTKNQKPNVLQPLMNAGIYDFGENRIEHAAMMTAAAPVGARFHYIGRIQGRQIPKAVTIAESIHSICDANHIDRLARACLHEQKNPEIFIQVNTGGEEQKAGIDAGDLDALLEHCNTHGDAFRVVGLMCMAPFLANDQEGDKIRKTFSALRELAHARGLQRLSMGMSNDFTIAIEEGATDVRIGTRLFV